MSHDDFDFEPIPGLPERPPPGEKILWQGKPDWWGLALRVFHIRKVAIYFAILLAWRGIATVYDGGTLTASLLAMLSILPLALLGLGLLGLLAALYARTTIYTITSRRVVMRFGVALPMTVNFPFTVVESASLRLCGDGTGDIPLALKGPDKLAYLVLWPFVRPGHYKRPQPMLRALPEAGSVAATLSAALKEGLGEGRIQSVTFETKQKAKAPVRQPELAGAEH